MIRSVAARNAAMGTVASRASLLSACQTGGEAGRFDPYFTQPLRDYFFGKTDDTGQDPDFLYGEDIDGAG